MARQGQPLNVVDDQIGSPTFTFDLAETTLELLDRGAGGIWHLANTGQTSWFGFAQAILDQFGVSTALNRINSDEWKRQRPQSATRPRYSVLDSGPFSRLVGRPIRAWQEALRDYARLG